MKKYRVVMLNAVIWCILAVCINTAFSVEYNLHQYVILGFITLGLTFEMLSGVLDFAWITEIALATCVGAFCLNVGLPFVLVVGVMMLCHLLCGMIKGVLISRLKVSPILLTLVWQRVLHGGCDMFGKTQILYARQWDVYGNTWFWGIMMALLVICYVLSWFGLGKTYYGRYIRMLGEDEPALENSGMNCEMLRIVISCLSGLCFCAASVIIMLITSSGSADNGSYYLYPAIVAVCLGGINFLRGTGRLSGTICGTLTVVLFMNLLAKWSVFGYSVYTVEVVVILVSVMIFGYRKKN